MRSGLWIGRAEYIGGLTAHRACLARDRVQSVRCELSCPARHRLTPGSVATAQVRHRRIHRLLPCHQCRAIPLLEQCVGFSYSHIARVTERRVRPQWAPAASRKRCLGSSTATGRATPSENSLRLCNESGLAHVPPSAGQTSAARIRAGMSRTTSSSGVSATRVSAVRTTPLAIRSSGALQVYGAWQVGNLSATDYTKKAKKWAHALQLVDPTIQLVSCGEQVGLPHKPLESFLTGRDRRATRTGIGRSCRGWSERSTTTRFTSSKARC